MFVAHHFDGLIKTISSLLFFKSCHLSLWLNLGNCDCTLSCFWRLILENVASVVVDHFSQVVLVWQLLLEIAMLCLQHKIDIVAGVVSCQELISHHGIVKLDGVGIHICLEISV